MTHPLYLFCITLVTTNDESSVDFAQALADFGVDNAVYWNSCTTGSSRYESTERMVISIF